MFGRRTPDRPLDQPAAPPKNEIDLGMLDDLPTIPPADPARATPTPPAPALDDPWSAPTPAMLGPSVTQLLRAAEVAGQPAPPVAAPAPAITQQLPVIDLSPAIESVHSQLWAAQEVYADPFDTPVIDAPQAPPTISAELGIAPESLWSPPATPAEPAAAPAPAAAPDRQVAESVIGPDDFFDGHYRSERGVRIQGAARGAIESRQYILVEAGAQVEAELAAEAITIAGAFTGKIACRGRLEIAATGTVQGSVETAMLVVHAGGSLDGELHMLRPAA